MKRYAAEKLQRTDPNWRPRGRRRVVTPGNAHGAVWQPSVDPAVRAWLLRPARGAA